MLHTMSVYSFKNFNIVNCNSDKKIITERSSIFPLWFWKWIFRQLFIVSNKFKQ